MDIKNNITKVFNILDSLYGIYKELHETILNKLHSIQSSDFSNLLELEKKENTILIRINILSKSLSATLFNIKEMSNKSINRTEDLFCLLDSKERLLLQESRDKFLFIAKKTNTMNRMVQDILFELNNIEKRLIFSLNNSLGETVTYEENTSLKAVSGLNIIG